MSIRARGPRPVPLYCGTAAQTIWVWNLDHQSWRALALTGPQFPSSRVLSAGYDADGQRLYVLDVDDDDHLAQEEFARLYRIDLTSARSTQLLRVPYTGRATNRVAVMADGTLALLSASDNLFTVWKLDGRGHEPVYDGVLSQAGRWLDGPIMGDDQLFVAYEQNGDVFTFSLAPERFQRGDPCTEL